ncbi:MAG TPA: hypothetical protein VG365_10550 [Solirubrobacteraceae bacterium]|nr:hypothetical protein [Solirubrobacteraceae bacterium]
MSDLPATTAVGIETVEWSAETGGNLTLRITGRWRRRRPAATGQPTLVIEAEGRRHRFPALPEPPSLAGTAPGVWRLSFTVHGWLAPDLGRTWLQFGTVIVPLPVAVPAPEPSPAESASGTPPPARLPAVAVELSEARAERDGLADAAASEAARLAFEDVLRQRRAQVAVRVASEPVAMAGRPSAALEPPPPPAMPPPAMPPPDMPPPAMPPPGIPPLPPPALLPSAADAGGLLVGLRQELSARARAEASLRARLVDAESRLAARVLLERRTTAVLHELRGELETLRDALSRERTLREQAERVAGEVERERALRAEAERRLAELERQLEGQQAFSSGADDAIGELRAALEQLSAPRPASAPVTLTAPSEPPTPGAPPSVDVVEPARLNDALSRLRDTVSPQDAPAAEPGGEAELERSPSLSEVLGRPSLEGPFRKLVRGDPEAAGRLLLDLLPLQRVVYPHNVAYDLVLGSGRGQARPAGSCVCVTVPNETISIAVQSAPRPRDEVDFQVCGDPARIARLVTAGRFRRRFSPRVARVRGRREGVAALTALLGTPLDLRELHRAGVRPDPAIAFALVARMIDPAWTRGERFTLAHEDPRTAATFLLVRDGGALQVARRAPEAGIAATLVCSADQLLAVLAGEAVPRVDVRGDERPMAALREWIKLAQSV